VTELAIKTDFCNPLQGALAVAFVGLPTFPCNAEKRPTCPKGFLQAARSPIEVRKLWAQWPGVLVGVPTGVLTDLSIVDLDSKHPEARNWFKNNRARLGKTRVHRTRSGGLHLLYRHQPSLRCSVSKLAPGVDIRSEGGYIIWWPAHGCEVPDNGDPAPFPQWLWKTLKPPPKPFEPPASEKRDESAMRGLMRRLVCAATGERNAVLFWASCRAGEHIRSGRVREEYARQCLFEAAMHVGLPQSEVKKTIESGIRTGAK